MSFIGCKAKPTETTQVVTEITGQVSDKATTNIVSGASITTNPTTSSVASDANGNYTIPNLQAGQYSVTATKDGYSPATISVTVTEGNTSTADIQMETLKPQLSVSVPSIDFGTTQSTSSFVLSNATSVGTISYSIALSANWLSLNPTSGTISNGNATITVTATRAGLAFGNYSTNITVTSNGGNQDIPVTMTVSNPNAPQLTVSPIAIDFGTNLTSLSFTIQNTGTGKLSWNASSAQSWISITPTSDTSVSGIDNVKITVNRSGLPPTNYTGAISVTSNAGSQSVSVKMNVPAVPSIGLSTTSLDFDSTQTQLSFVVSNTGSGTLNWSASANQSWITIAPQSGSNTGTVNISVSRTSLSPGSYSGAVSLTSNGGNGSVAIAMKVAAPAPPSPVTLQVGTLTVSSVALAWSIYSNALDFGAYRIYYSTSPAVTENSTLATTITDRTNQSYTVTGLASNTQYYFRVYVLNAAQLTSGSNTVNATTLAKLGSWSVVVTLSHINYPEQGLSALAYLADNNVWVSGGLNYFGDNIVFGFVSNYNGSFWHAITIPDSSVSVSCMNFQSANEGYAVTTADNYGEGEVFRYNGISWSTILSGSNGYSLCILSSNNILVGGSAQILKWNGSAWSTTSLNSSNIIQIKFVSANEGYALDKYGKMFAYKGVGWSLMGTVGSTSLTYSGLGVINGNDIWVGGQGGAYHYDGSTWTQYTVPVSSSALPNTNSIDMVATNNGWACGNGGLIYHWDGSSWKSVTSPTSEDLNFVKMTSATDGWMVGQNGGVLRYH